VVIIADLIAAELQSGCKALRRTAVALTWGHAIDVPYIMLYLTLRRSPSSLLGDDDSLHAAKIFRPGAVISG